MATNPGPQFVPGHRQASNDSFNDIVPVTSPMDQGAALEEEAEEVEEHNHEEAELVARVERRVALVDLIL